MCLRHSQEPCLCCEMQGRMDDASLSSWKEITSQKYKRVVISNYTDLLTFAEDSQLTHNLSAMSYEELLTGMLYPGEALQFVPPARVKHYRKLALDGTVLQAKGTVRAFFSDKRLFLIHTNFFQHPTMKDPSRKGKPLTTGLKEISCNLEDNLFWTAINLEKLQAQSIDCEYKAAARTTVIVSRPKWAAWLLLLATVGIISTAFISQDSIAHVIVVGALSLLLFGVGAWSLLMGRTYKTERSDPESYRSRKLLIGYDDPLHMQKVTLDCEMEEDYALMDAFEWIQGVRTVCRALAGDKVEDSDDLLSKETMMAEGQDGKSLSQGVRHAPTQNTVRELKKIKEKGKSLREQLEESELKKLKPPKDTSKRKDVAVLDENFEEAMVRVTCICTVLHFTCSSVCVHRARFYWLVCSPVCVCFGLLQESVEDIKARMKDEMAERKKRKKERRAKGVHDERFANEDDFDTNFKIVDFSSVDTGMGNKRFTSRFSFMQRDNLGKVDQRWDAGDVNEGGDFWKVDGPTASEQDAAAKAEKRAAAKEAKKKLKDESNAQEEGEEENDNSKKKKKKKKTKKVNANAAHKPATMNLTLHIT